MTGGGLTGPFHDLLEGDRAGRRRSRCGTAFPLPWEIKTNYKISIRSSECSINGTWELQKPQKPDFIIFPPASDIENLFQPPDLSGIDLSNPALDVCEAIVALFEGIIKTIDAIVKLIGDIIKMLVSPSTYLDPPGALLAGDDGLGHGQQDARGAGAHRFLRASPGRLLSRTASFACPRRSTCR